MITLFKRNRLAIRTLIGKEQKGEQIFRQHNIQGNAGNVENATMDEEQVKLAKEEYQDFC